MALSIETGQKQSSQAGTIPAPTGGVLATANLAAMDMSNCIYTYNLLPSQNGMRIRSGSVVDSELVGDEGNGLEVRTLVSYKGPEPSGGQDRLFAICSDGIYDVTSGSTQPSVLTGGNYGAAWTNSGNAGFGVFTTFTNNSGTIFLLYADALNGLFVYDNVTAVWNVAGFTGTGLSMATVRYVAVHMNRVWLIQGGETQVFYGGIGGISGAAATFPMGNQIKTGGDLVAVTSWTIDGGRGMDDHLVAISRSGDVIVWQGVDPSNSTTWKLVGSWTIGELPAGYRCLSRFGGNVYVLCLQGLIDLRTLLGGIDSSEASLSGPTAAVSRILRRHLNSNKGSFRWAVLLDTVNSAVVITTPTLANGQNIQYVMDLAGFSWGFWRGLDITTLAAYDNRVYWGSPDGEVVKMVGTSDKVQFDGTGALPVEFSILTAYSDMGAPGVNKRIHFIRPVYTAGSPQSSSVKALYNYEISEIFNTDITQDIVDGDVWNVGEWDKAVWGGSLGSIGFEKLHGANGMGRVSAIAMRGESDADFNLIAWDTVFDTGGAL
jgi:hypothetical protein